MRSIPPTLFATVVLSLGVAGSSHASEITLSSLTPEQSTALVKDAYVYAYPLVLMDVTQRQATNVPNATTASMRAPINQFAHFRSYPKADARDVVRFNFDTLYSMRGST